MNEPYVPKSDFIWMVVNEDAPLTGSAAAEHNLRLLIALTRDADTSNRDWATMALAQQDLDTPDVRNALLAATNDSDACVRAEALQGLAERDKEVALPLVERELNQNECGYGTFQAARIIAHPSLLDGLRAWAGKGSAPWIDDEIKDAIAACEAALTSKA